LSEDADNFAGEQSSVGVSNNLGMSLNFLSGKGLLSLKDKAVGALDLKLMELEIPEVAFPFDVSGGAERFKHRRCHLHRLVCDINAKRLRERLRDVVNQNAGFVDLKAWIADGYVDFAGRFAVGDHQADFTFRAAPLVRSHTELDIIFFDTRVYGWLPIPAPLIPHYLVRAMKLPVGVEEKAGILRLTPVVLVLRSVLPRFGWKLPSAEGVQLVEAKCARGRITLVAGSDHEPSQRQATEREPNHQALRASEGMLNHMDAEEALFRGQFAEAFENFHESLAERMGGEWAKVRALQLGVTDPELHTETRVQIQNLLDEQPHHVQALLAAAALSVYEGSFGEAQAYYQKIAEIVRNERRNADVLAAEIAAAEVTAKTDPALALQLFERSALRARDSRIAHEALFTMRQSHGDWEGAVLAGERLAKLESDDRARGTVLRDLGSICCHHLHDFRRARMHFEKALKINPQDTEAMEGLADTYASRGEPARAASYLERLVEQAEQAQDEKRAIELNIRLGDILERWLGHSDAAAQRYQRVLGYNPHHRQALLRLAELAEHENNLNDARGYYEDVLSLEHEAEDDHDAVGDIVSASVRLARLTESTVGVNAEVIANLERAVELDPGHAVAQGALVRVLRTCREWSRLFHQYEAWAAAADDEKIRFRAHLEAARLGLKTDAQHNRIRSHLEAALDIQKSSPEVLKLLVPLLEEDEDNAGLNQCLALAAQSTSEPDRRSELYYRLAIAREDLGLAWKDVLDPLKASLDANPYRLAAALRLADLTREHSAHAQLADALERVATASTDMAQKRHVLIERAGLLAEHLDGPQAAEICLAEAIALDPEVIDTWVSLSSIQSQRGDLAAARDTLREILHEVEPASLDAAELHRHLAKNASQRGDLNEEAEYLRPLTLGPYRNRQNEGRLAEVLQELGKLGELADLTEFWSRQAEGEQKLAYRLKLAEINHSMGDYPRAQHILYELLASPSHVGAEAAIVLEQLARGQEDGPSVVRALERQLEAKTLRDQLPLRERLVNLHLEREDRAEAERECHALIAIDLENVKGRLQLLSYAQHDERHEAVYDHIFTLVNSDRLRHVEQNRRGKLFALCVGLALELAPEDLSAIRVSCENLCPELKWEDLMVPYGAVLAAKQAWPSLVALRKTQLQSAQDERRFELRREIANIFYEHLNQLSDAAELYENILRHSPADGEIRDKLIEIYQTTDNTDDLAKLYIFLAQTLDEENNSSHWIIRAASLYGDTLKDPGAAEQALRHYCHSKKTNQADTDLLSCLEDFECFDLVADILESSLRRELAAGDGRLLHFVETTLKQLSDAPRAMQMCKLCIEKFPLSDIPWTLACDVAKFSSDHAHVRDLYRQWCEKRDGSSRSGVLRQHAEFESEQGQWDVAMELLEEALGHTTDAHSIQLLLLDVYEKSGRWLESVDLLESLIEGSPTTGQKDEHLRRLLAIALGHLDDKSLAASCIERLGGASEEDDHKLAELYLGLSRFEDLASINDLQNILSANQLVAAGTGLGKAGFREASRACFERMLGSGVGEWQLWDIIEQSWTESDGIQEYARWRLEWAQSATATHGPRHLLKVYNTLKKANEKLFGSLLELNIEEALASLDLGSIPECLMALDVARYAGLFDWAMRAARLLENQLPHEHSQLPKVLSFLAQEELERGNLSEAIRLANELKTVKGPASFELYEDILEKAERHSDLLEHLKTRAQHEPHAAAQHWMRVALLERSLGDLPEAVESLNNIPESHRSGQWAEILRELALNLERDDLALKATETLLHFANEPEETVRWLIESARLYWWSFDDKAKAAELLQRAHSIKPVEPLKSHVEAKSLLGENKLDEALCRMQESTLVLRTSECERLLLLLAQTSFELGNKSVCLETIQRLTDGGRELGEDWCRLGGICRESGDLVQAENCYQRAYFEDIPCRKEYESILKTNSNWQALVSLLETEANRCDDQTMAAIDLEKSGDLSAQHLDDPPGALAFYVGALRYGHTVQRTSKAYDLAVSLKRKELIADLGLSKLSEQVLKANERSNVLREVVDALDELGRKAEALPLRQELYDLSKSNARDLWILGEHEKNRNPKNAAKTFGACALIADNEMAGEAHYWAAYCWHREGDKEQLINSLRECFKFGYDSLPAHELAIDVFDGDERIRSLKRLYDLGGDAAYGPKMRADIRVDLAQAAHANEQNRHALTYLNEANELGRNELWSGIYEKVVTALGDEEALAEHLLNDNILGHKGYSPTEKRERLAKAAQIFKTKQRHHKLLEVLFAQLALEPNEKTLRHELIDTAQRAESLEQFSGMAEELCRDLLNESERVSLYHYFAQALESRLELPEDAHHLLMAGTQDTCSIELAGLLCQGATPVQYGAVIGTMMHCANEASDDDRLEFLTLAARVATNSPTRLQEATSLYQLVLESDPSNIEAREHCVRVISENEDWLSVAEIYEKAANADKEDSLALYLRAADICRENIQDYEREHRLLKTCWETGGHEPTLALALLGCKFSLGLHSEALDMLRSESLTKEAAYPFAITLKNKCILDNQHALKSKLLGWAAGVYPDSILKKEWEIEEYRKKGDSQALLSVIEGYLEYPELSDPKQRSDAHVEAGQLFHKQLKSEKALEHYLAAASIGPVAAETLLIAVNLAASTKNELAHQGLSEMASTTIDEIRQAVQKFGPTTDPNGNIRGFVAAFLEKNGFQDEAEPLYVDAVFDHEGTIPEASFEQLQNIYRKRGDWGQLFELLNHDAQKAKDPIKASAKLSHIGWALLDVGENKQKAEVAFREALTKNPQNIRGQRGLAFVLTQLEQDVQACVLYDSLWEKHRDELNVTDCETYLITLDKLHRTEDSIVVAQDACARFKEAGHLHYHAGEILYGAKNFQSSQEAFRRFVHMGPSGADTEKIQRSYQYLLDMATQGQRHDDALGYLKHLSELRPNDVNIHVQHADLRKKTGDWQGVSDAQRKALALTEDSAQKKRLTQDMAEVLSARLDKHSEAADLLRAHAGEPMEDVAILHELFRVYEREGNWPQLLVIGKRIMELVEEPELEADFFERMAFAHQSIADDYDAAKMYYRKAAALQPDNPQLQKRNFEMAKISGDFASFAADEELAIESLADDAEKVARYRELAEVYVRHLQDIQKAATVLSKARELRPTDLELVRQLADTYAQQPVFFERAVELYAQLLDADPMRPDVLRIMARLSGPLKQTDKIYGYYAALLALSENDEEARQYVAACRSVRLQIPQISLGGAQWTKLEHVDVKGPCQDLYQASADMILGWLGDNMPSAGAVLENRQSPEEDHIASLMRLADYVALSRPEFFSIDKGGFTCSLEIAENPQFVIGEALFDGGNRRERSFVFSKAAASFKLRHPMHGRIASSDYERILKALCLAVVPDVDMAGQDEQVQALALQLQNVLKPANHTRLGPLVKEFAKQEASVEIWVRAVNATVHRAALLVACDIDEALSAMRKEAGVPEQGSQQWLRDTPEAKEILRFALSDRYFELRQEVGLALRAQGA
jgi:Flp pilus assembly protein TadD